MNPRRGDVVLVLFPNSDLRTAKRRPALVLQRDSLRSGLQQTIVAMISSNMARRGHPSRVFVGAASAEGRAGGLRLDSVIMTDNIATVSRMSWIRFWGNCQIWPQLMWRQNTRWPSRERRV
jgi:mRNA interferase MazF